MVVFIVITFVAIILVFLWCACRTNSEISRLEEKEMLKNEQNENSRK